MNLLALYLYVSALFLQVNSFSIPSLFSGFGAVSQEDDSVYLGAAAPKEFLPESITGKPDGGVAEDKSTNKIIPYKYIVVFNDEATKEQISEHTMWVNTQYDAMVQVVQQSEDSYLKGLFKGTFAKKLEFFDIHDSFRGYYGLFTDALLETIKGSELVKFIERDSVVHTTEFDVEEDATWGLSRISHRYASKSNEYLYDSDGGKGVNVYIVDTGIKTDHDEFESRASWGAAIALPNLKVDGHGHGTHCAGIVGSKTYGVAKKADLVAVAVLNFLGSGAVSDIIKGIEFVVNDHKKNVQSGKKGFKGSVINMSLGGGVSDAIDLAVNTATKAGVHIAVAAGNDNQDACDSSPARAAGGLTVGATNNADSRASFSNFGKCVDIFAPGEDILSTFTWTRTTTMSGTSMASPHVAGLLAYFLSLYPETNSEFASLIEPTTLKSRVLKYGTKGVIDNLVDGLSPNVLAFNGAGGNLTSFWGL